MRIIDIIAFPVSSPVPRSATKIRAPRRYGVPTMRPCCAATAPWRTGRRPGNALRWRWPWLKRRRTQGEGCWKAQIFPEDLVEHSPKIHELIIVFPIPILMWLMHLLLLRTNPYGGDKIPKMCAGVRCLSSRCILGMELVNRLGVAGGGCLVHWPQDALNVYLTGKAALDGIGPLETLSEGQRLAVEGAPQYGASEKEWKVLIFTFTINHLVKALAEVAINWTFQDISGSGAADPRLLRSHGKPLGGSPGWQPRDEGGPVEPPAALPCGVSWCRNRQAQLDGQMQAMKDLSKQVGAKEQGGPWERWLLQKRQQNSSCSASLFVVPCHVGLSWIFNNDVFLNQMP